MTIACLGCPCKHISVSSKMVLRTARPASLAARGTSLCSLLGRAQSPSKPALGSSSLFERNSRGLARRLSTVGSDAQTILSQHLETFAANLPIETANREQLLSKTKGDLIEQLRRCGACESSGFKLVTSLDVVILLETKNINLPSATTLSSPVTASKSRIVPFRWLRENCRCSDCVNPDTLQRRINVLDSSNHGPATISSDSKGFEILWGHQDKVGEPHTSYYSDEWLRKTLFEQQINPDSGATEAQSEQRLFFDGNCQTLPEVSYDQVIQKGNSLLDGMGTLTNHIVRQLIFKNVPVFTTQSISKARSGFVLVKGAPATPEATQDLLEKIGPIRNTHYGGFYDFQPNLEFRDTAYTNEALELHTDTTYFTEPAGLQAFHLLSHHPPPGYDSSNGSLGGQTLLLDGLHCADRLRQESPESYEILCKTELPWHASGNEDVAIAPLKPYPVIERTAQGLPFRIRWNNADRGIVPTTTSTSAYDWYNAAAKFQALLVDPVMNLNLQLEPGTILIFDNWRVLHGRTSFEGARRMSGGYINRDDFVSRLRLSRTPRKKVVDDIMKLDRQTL